MPHYVARSVSGQPLRPMVPILDAARRIHEVHAVRDVVDKRPVEIGVIERIGHMGRLRVAHGCAFGDRTSI